MSEPPRVFRGRRVVLDTVRPASIHVENGIIRAIGGYDDITAGALVTEVGDSVLMAGLVDTHVHADEPGRTEWEGFETLTRAAAAGGVTTMLDMPLNSIPATTTVDALEEKRRAATGKCHIDVGFIGGVVPGNADQLEPLAQAGCLAFKCFLVPSGVPEFEHVGEADLRTALPIVARTKRPLMAHSESPDVIAKATARLGRTVAHSRRYADYLASRPDFAERDAVLLLATLGRESDVHLHIVHVASGEAVTVIEAARARGVHMTAETCPHYLYFAAEGIPDRATEYKCAPPIRGAANREALWDALRRGVIESIVSDHSPCPPALRDPEEGRFFAAWGGIGGIELGLSAVWTGARDRGFDITHLARWMSEAAARLVGLERKGRLAVGCDADFVVWTPERTRLVIAGSLHCRHQVSPYRGKHLAGVVEATYLRGQPVYLRGEDFPPPRGTLLSATGT